MLSIRREQMKVLEAAQERRFRESLRRHVRHELREETRALQDDVVKQRIDLGVDRGRHYGLRLERDLMLFVDLDFALAPNFEQLPNLLWARRILASRTIEPDAKMDMIYQRLAARQAPQEEPGTFEGA